MKLGGMMYKHIGLFEGIGGFSLAARWAGWETIAWCEINPFGQKVLKYHFPKATGHDDIKKTDFTIYRGKCDILTGGFPCQPYSLLGKRLGTEDDRHLWPEMLRAIREIQPGYVVGENVRGLTNWNGGLVFDQIQADLEAEGYEVIPFLLPACAVNAPHRRERIWFIANRKSEQSTCKIDKKIGEQKEGKFGGVGSKANVSDSHLCRQTRSGRAFEQMHSKEDRNWEERRTFDVSRWESISPICGGDYGLPRELLEECLEGLGNAIVPQVAYEIFKVINLMRDDV